MSLDTIRIVDEPDMARPDKSLTANSIHFKVESLATAEEKIKYLKEKRDEALDRARQLVSDAVKIAAEQPVEAMNKEEEAEKYAHLVAELEKDIRIVKGVPDKAELVESRAIKLMDKMYAEATSKSNVIYGFNIVQANKPSDEIKVEEIAKAQEEPLAEKIESAVGEKTLSDGDVRDIFDEVFAAQEVVDSEDVERIANEKLNAEETKTTEEPKVEVTEGSEDYEYTPMTDSEVAKAQENIELEKYSREYAERAKNFDAQYAADLEAVKRNYEENQKQVRDDVIVAPERKEPAEEKIEEYISVEDKVDTVETPAKVEEKVEPRSTSITMETKGKLEGYRDYSLEELEKIISDSGKSTEELKAKASSVEEAKEAEKKKNAEIAREQEDAEKRRQELEEERTREAQELKDMMIERAVALDAEKDSLESAIQSSEEEIASINKDSETRREQITSINTDSKSLQDEIEKYRQMKKMFSKPGESEDSKQAVR